MSTKLRQIKYLLTSLTFFLALSFGAAAQFIPEPLSLTATPGSPSPGETTTFLAATPTLDPYTTFFDWIVDGKRLIDQSGMGKNTIQTKAGAVGSSIQASVVILPQRGLGGRATLTTRVSELSIVWSAETYTPKWYKGRTLPTAGSIISFVAMPEFTVRGEVVPSENLIYKWGLDDEDKALVGVGKQVFRVQTSKFPGTSHQIRLSVEDLDKQILKQKTLFVTTVAPQALIYKVTPLGGIETRSSSRSAVSGGRDLLDFAVEPFFWPVKSPEELSFAWGVNGARIENKEANPRLLTVDLRGYGRNPVYITATVSKKDLVFGPVKTTTPLLLKND